MKKIIIILILTAWSFTHASTPSQVFHRSFWHPQYHGERLNYCTLDGQCGLKVATSYCQMMGYEKADQALIANNVGLTNYLHVKARCVGWRCNGFKTIRCMNVITHKPPKPYHYRLRRFVYPRFNNYRIDWCYDGKKGCGQRAAFSFCRRLGYMSVKRYTIEKNVPATQAIGNQKLCFGSQCNAFTKIDCFR